MPSPLRSLLVLVCVLFLAVAPARASEASDAYKHASDLAKQVEQASTDEERTAAQDALSQYVHQQTARLGAQELSKMDTAYLGRMQNVGGMHQEAVATLEKALAHPGTTKYLSSIHLFYIRALVDAGNPDKAFTALQKMANDFPGDKYLKTAAMDVGIALRGERRWKDSAVALDIGLKAKDPAALKPLVNSLLLDGRKADAIAAIEWAIEKAGEEGADPAHQVLLDITRKFGEVVPVEYDAFVPAETQDVQGKVQVLGFWNVSAGSLRWTMEYLQSLYDEFPPTKGVAVLGVSTYYQKNPDTGKFEDTMTPEAERAIGESYKNQYGYAGPLAYLKDRDALQALGCAALPYFVILGKDGKLIYAHTVNRADPTELEVIREIIRKAL